MEVRVTEALCVSGNMSSGFCSCVPLLAGVLRACCQFAGENSGLASLLLLPH